MTLTPPSNDRARALIPLVALLVGALASVVTAGYLRRVEDGDTRHGFTNRSVESTQALARGLEGSGDSLRGVRGLFDGSETVSADEFARFVDALDLARRYPGLTSVAYVRNDVDRRVVFDHPLGGARAPVTAGPAARAAQDRARDEGTLASTVPVHRPGETGADFLVFVPVYDGAGIPADVATRRARLAGWVVNAYAGGPFVAGQGAGVHAVEFALYQGSAVTPDGLVGASPGYADAAGNGKLVRDTRIDAYGVRWTVRTVAPRGFTPTSYVVAPWILLGFGLVLTLLGAIVMRAVLSARRRAETQVAATTRTLRANEERFRALVEHSPTGVFFADVTGDLAYWNPRLLDITGMTDLGDDDPRLLLHPDDVPKVVSAFTTAIVAGTPVRGTYRVVRPDGRVRWLDLAASPTRAENGDVTGWVGTANDVTEAVEATRHTDRLTRMLEHTTDLVTLTGPDGTVVWANDAARRHMAAAGIEPRRLADLVAPSARAYFEGAVLPEVAREGMWRGELMLVGADGRELPVSQLIQAHYGSDGEVLHYSFCARDLSERRDYQTRLAHEVLHDRLTGLPNRALFVDRLVQSFARTQRRDTLLAVLCVDLDRFKNVNDSLGHEAGDRLLIEVAARMESVLRSGDTAARFGGDEFTLLCEEVADEDQATAIAQRVLSVLSVPFVLDGTPLHLSASVGIALCDGTSNTRPEDLIRDADAALHRAKELGKARYELFDERVRAHAVARFQTESALHEALDLGQLRVYYQPEVSLRTGRVIGAEALVRWLHPDTGLVPPAEFIPLAEETGLVGPIGSWVLREACWQAARWRNAREDGERFTVWVNLSPRQLTPSLVDEVTAVLAETGIHPDQLGFEVTETALLGDADAAIEVLRGLRGLGTHIVIDDFGTGYSSLAYLRRLPVSGVKIDRTFVANLGHEPEDAAIVAAVVAMSKALGLTTIAEGVETRMQLDELVALGCQYAQGYYFARPEPRQAIDALLAQHPEWPGLDVPSQRATPVSELEDRRRRRNAGP